jgi:hypothetical protein
MQPQNPDKDEQHQPATKRLKATLSSARADPQTPKIPTMT